MEEAVGNDMHGISQDASKVTNEGLEQSYCVVPSAKRFILLYTFLKRNVSKKVMVFFSSSKSVKFYSELLRCNQVDCFDIHEKQEQHKQNASFIDFCTAEKGILLCSNVAARGLSIPAMDWLVQYDPPDEPEEYVRRVGQIASEEGAKGNALLFLTSKELQFLLYFKAERVDVKKYEFNEKKLANVSHLEKTVAKNYSLNRLSKDAYRSYVLSYNSHPNKNIFDVRQLDLQAVAASFFYFGPPMINLKIDNTPSESPKKRRKF